MAAARITTEPRTTAGGLYALKPWFVARLRSVEDRAVARGVTADQLTWAGALAGGATAAALLAGTGVPWLWLTVPPLSLARMACNALDGAVARRTSTATARGAVANELADRAADLVTFAALAPIVGAGLAAAAAVTALASSFVAVLAQAVTGRRLALGPLGKPDRVAVLSVGATAAAFAGANALVATAWVLVAAGLVTLGRRTLALWREAGVRQ
jgi:CDP-diacylglycerol---glycerol-3-phosphate 3-phosphatidyltransferase